jgi:hypothetical protein
MGDPKPRGFIALALNAEVRAAGNRWQFELVPLEDVDERLSHAAIKALTAYLEDLKGRVVAGVQFGGMRPLCLPCRDPVPNPMTVGLMSAAVAEPRTIIVNAICERCAALPLAVLQEDCQAAFAEWIADLKMVKDK